MSKRSQAVRSRAVKARQNFWLEKAGELAQNKYLRKLVMASVVIAVFYAGVYQLEDVEVLPIETVKIEGEFKYLSRDKLKNSSLPYVSGGFFSVDLDKVRDHLLTMPWVEDVSIRRQWPNMLMIRVIEKQPVAYWGEAQLLSSKGELFKPEQLNRNMVIPRLSGPDGQHENMLKELGRMQAWLIETGLMINRIRQDDRRSWTLQMESGIELRLGRSDQEARLNRFVDVYMQQLLKQKQKIKYIDMRYTNGLAIAWKQAQQDQGA